MPISFSLTFYLIALFSTGSNALDIANLNAKKLLGYQQPEGSDFSSNFPSPYSSSSSDNIENSLNPDQYFIGGGDEFFISVIGIPSIRYFGSINEHGDLYVAELGLKKLGKISLTEAQKKIGEFVQTKLKKPNEVYVSLSKAKKASISVNGAVSRAGTYVLPGICRVLDALKDANEDKIPSMSDRNFREIRCANKDTTKIIDLFTYLLKNDISSNPYIYPGDNITIEFATKRVYINAPLKAVVSGWVPIKEQEKLSDFLSLFKFDASADTSTILFQSATEIGKQSIRSISWNEAATIVLHDRDIITIPQKKNYGLFLMISVSGEVTRPGFYPITKDSTTVDDLLAMAGGPTQFANVDRTIIVRRSKVLDGKIDDPYSFPYSPVSPIPQIPQITANQLTTGISPIRPEMSAGYTKMTTINDYSIIEVKKHGGSITLLANDNLIVPPKEAYIYVSGNVKRPGAYLYVAQASYKYYISEAGGFTGKADKSNLFGMRNYTGVSQMIDLNEIAEGDIIVVPDSQQAKFFSTILLPIISTAAGIASLFLAAYAVYHK
jgi:protein involved in polysaccharide export with SLBB domain